MSRYFNQVNIKNDILLGSNSLNENWRIFNQGTGPSFDLVAQEFINNSGSTGPIYSLIKNKGPTGPQGLPGAGGALGYYGAFFDTTTQGTNNTSGTAMRFNSAYESNGVSIVDNTKVKFNYPGTYNLQFSSVFLRNSANTDTIDIWFVLNGTGIANSNTEFDIAGQANSVAAWNFVKTLNANDEVEVYWKDDKGDDKTTMVYSGATGSLPAIPSVILTATQVMYTQVGPTGPSFSASNLLWVAKNGPSTGANGSYSAPYPTISQALTAATGTTGTSVWIMPGVYQESISIPNTTSVCGHDSLNTVIELSGVTGNTTLVEMGNDTLLQDLTLNLSSTGHYTLKGVSFVGASSIKSVIKDIYVNVDNSNASSTGTSNVYGIFMTSTTGLTPEYTNQVIGSTVVVRSTGNGEKRGIYVDGVNPIQGSIRGTNSFVYGYGTGHTGSFIGAEITGNTGSFLDLKNCTISSTGLFGATGTYADISQTQGTLSLTSTELVNATANGKSFTVGISPANLTFGFAGVIKNNDIGIGGNNNSYLYPGASTITSANIVSTITNTKKILFSLSATCSTGPQNPNGIDTFTLYKNGSPTSLSLTLSTNNTSQTVRNQSVSFLTNDKISIFYTGTGGAGGGSNNGSTNPIIDLSLY